MEHMTQIVVRGALLRHREVEHRHAAALIDDDVHRRQVGMNGDGRHRGHADFPAQIVESRQRVAPIRG